jgi:hypothetical protein
MPEGMRLPQAEWDRLCPDSRRYLITLFETWRALERRVLQDPALRARVGPDPFSRPAPPTHERVIDPGVPRSP